MTNDRNAIVIKALSELGLYNGPKSLSPDILEINKRVHEYEKEMGTEFDPELLKKYLGK